LTNRFLTNLGLARRAGKVARGREETLEQLRAGALAGVFVASDVSTRSRRDIAAACAQNGKEYVPLPFTMEQLGNALGARPTAVFGISDSGLNGLLMSAAPTAEKEAGYECSNEIQGL